MKAAAESRRRGHPQNPWQPGETDLRHQRQRLRQPELPVAPSPDALRWEAARDEIREYLEASEKDEEEPYIASDPFDSEKDKKLSQIKAAILRASAPGEMREVEAAMKTETDWRDVPNWIKCGPTLTQYRRQQEQQPSTDWAAAAGIRPRRLEKPPDEVLPHTPPPQRFSRAFPVPPMTSRASRFELGNQRETVSLQQARELRRLARQRLGGEGPQSLPALSDAGSADATALLSKGAWPRESRRPARRHPYLAEAATLMRTSGAIEHQLQNRRLPELPASSGVTVLRSSARAVRRDLDAMNNAMMQVSWSLPHLKAHKRR
eukprot:TRINITY_DN38376_c0_g1_i1.p1 TRINITY_DN38376_c0_g1~~TRINITY_DN38376_c0_g1_i1.p1  ORF type:complete len:320 (+),score=65.64 TRINITY_DN38376_c0_g1_i1:102-1061(+)